MTAGDPTARLKALVDAITGLDDVAAGQPLDRAHALTVTLAFEDYCRQTSASSDLQAAVATLRALASSAAPAPDAETRDRASRAAVAITRVLPPPSEAVILERAKSLCNEACFTVALQHRRLKSTEPEDEIFEFRWHADLQFLIVALRRLRRAALLAATAPAVSHAANAALAHFDQQLPALTKMRNVGEHIDEYVQEGKQPGQRDSRRHKDVRRGALQLSSWDGSLFNWLGVDLDIDVALKAAEALFSAVSDAVKQFTKNS